MLLPKKSRELEMIFREAAAPAASALLGTYAVDMLTGVPSLRWWNHRKRIWSGVSAGGCNLVGENLDWGYFRLRNATCPLDGRPAVLVDYDVWPNGFSRRFCDHLRCTDDPCILLGRFSCRLFGQPRFLGYFSLIKL